VHDDVATSELTIFPKAAPMTTHRQVNDVPAHQELLELSHDSQLFFALSRSRFS